MCSSVLILVNLAVFSVAFTSAFVVPSMQQHSVMPDSRVLDLQADADCFDKCGTFFFDSDFISCSTVLTQVFSNVPTGLAISDADTYCDTRHCPSILTEAYRCMDENCSGEGVNDGIFLLVNQSCYHNQNDKTCFDAWIGFERDIQNDRNNITQFYDDCLEDLSCDSTSCSKLFEYYTTEVGCCYYTIIWVTQFGKDDRMTSLLHRCGQSSQLLTECASN